jgi:hypothetical protein
MKFGLTGIGVGLLAIAALAAACQTYDFEPVAPLAISQTTQKRLVKAKAGKPNVMLVVDTSFSMTDPVDPTDPDCTVNGQLCGSTSQPCTAACPTRLVEMKSAMNGFLTQNGSVARFGLARFPNAVRTDPSTVCRTGVMMVDIAAVADDDPTALQSWATDINTSIQSLEFAGGTPTAATLNMLATQPTLLDPDRKNIVLLLTDGLPNCNGNLNKDTCTCVTGATPCPTNLNCLDDQGAIGAVSALAQKEIGTIVIGFGADTGASIGRPTLNNMAVTGGYQRECTTNADCGTGDTCAGGNCTNIKFYQAANGAQLAQVLLQLQKRLLETDPCVVKFAPEDAPQNGDYETYLVVYVNGQKQAPNQPDTWTYSVDPVSGQPTVTFVGSTCTDLQNSDATHPVDVQIQILQML